MLYLMGEPMRVGPAPKVFSAPAGQFLLCQKVWQESSDMRVVAQNMAKEYWAIATMLQIMGVDFRIVHAHPDMIDRDILVVCVQGMKCRLMSFPPDFFPSSVAYPRDFCTVLPGLLLLSSNAIQRVTADEKNGWKLRVSPFGEGGRVLVQDSTMVACERAILQEGQSTPCHFEANELRSLGIKVGLFPSVMSARWSAGCQSSFSNDHIDRVACLLKAPDGKLFLVVDPNLVTLDWNKPAAVKPWSFRSREETRELLRKTMGSMGIQVCWPESITVPYALNLVQFPDGRVLMTGSDPGVKKLVVGIVGRENVFETPIPIRFFPAWANAGIHCLVSEAPMPLLISNSK